MGTREFSRENDVSKEETQIREEPGHPMRIVDHTPAYTPVPSSRAPRPYARVERIAAIPALPWHQRAGTDRGQYAGKAPHGLSLPPRGWLIDIYV
jgi:hypothetical protein